MAMTSTQSPTQDDDYARIEQAIAFLDENFQEQPDLAELAARVGLSPWHFQRMFRRWAGISPKRFLQFLTVDYARGLLERSSPVLDTAYDSGLSGPSRLHDLFVVTEAVTPGDVRRGGAGLELHHGVHDSPFGRCGLAMNERGICTLTFAPPDAAGDAWLVDQLCTRWPNATLIADQEATGDMVQRVFDLSEGSEAIPLHLRGTNFQIRVWEALMRMPPATVTSYQDLARRMGQESAVRAAASAVARNPVAFLIPCHRVIRKTGPFHNYAWGPVRKQAILGWEQARFGEGREAVRSAA
ncbi:MAG: methylated-DNA--[protein]-cysteine S-methyltransferase [Rhodospirillaceae bacterium]|nr:methylated-DNA--[protein]-cysteine S-methyltransferase [Rhodospirillaceae bacterium]MBT6205940.1 methylated-DNA--[protein]-cysteine S-methyltransferase [Rhodospirillaceae bacterium]MBT6512929.1 methylated-DNA--[protein]-cysteine S-methyltransferase [Rhodospirillaceae bacterium]MBT7612919.1 methylated-DNA--[protein]-cysteine S-methyltransferase [Rhodospirillaceae bacterium]